MHRPVDVGTSPTSFNTSVEQQTMPTTELAKNVGGKVSMAYYPNWAIYSGLNFPPTQIDPTELTHLIYSFADIDPQNGTVKLTDPYADEQIHFAGDPTSAPGNNLYGCLKQIYLLKLMHRNLKVILSVGGWTYTNTNGHLNRVGDATYRKGFVSSAVQLIKDYGFDGIDIDFEYPATAEQGQGLADLFTELRTAFTNLQKSNGDSTSYQLTAAVSSSSSSAQFFNIPQMNKALDYWNLMAYDYSGPWSKVADDQANVYGGQRSGISTDAAIKWYTSKGASASKISLGIPTYGRSFDGTTGIGAPYKSVGAGSVEQGIYTYHELPLAGSTVHENTTDISSYSYDPAKQELISFDTANIVKLKAQYAQSKGLAGSMFWSLPMDSVGKPGSLVTTSAKTYGSLDATQNHIHYPNSKWDNIRNNMGK